MDEKTLAIRTQKYTENALELAKWLQKRPRSGLGKLSRINFHQNIMI